MNNEVANQAALDDAVRKAQTNSKDPDRGFFELEESPRWRDLGYLGMSEDEAMAAANRKGIAEIRVFQLPIRTAYRLDHKPERLNLAIYHGRVIRAAFF